MKKIYIMEVPYEENIIYHMKKIYIMEIYHLKQKLVKLLATSFASFRKIL